MKRIGIFLVFFISSIPMSGQDNIWTGEGGDSNWNNNMNWSRGIPSETDTAVINGVVSGVNVSGNVEVGSIRLTQSILNTSASLSLSDTMFIDALSVVNWNGSPWADGIFMNYGAINYNAPSGTILFIDARLHNYGVFNHEAGNIVFYGSVINELGGIYDLLCESCLLNGTSNVTSDFLNHGTIKRSSVEDVRIAVKYSGRGRLEINEGSITFKNSQTKFENTEVYIDSDANLTLEVAQINGSISGENAGNFLIQNLTTSGKSELSVGNKGVNWEFSNWSGTDTLTNAGILTYSPSINLSILDGLVLENKGQMNLVPDAFLNQLNVRGTLLNRIDGTIEIRNDCNISGSGSFVNQGHLIKSEGEGSSIISVDFPESGGITVRSGTLKID